MAAESYSSEWRHRARLEEKSQKGASTGQAYELTVRPRTQRIIDGDIVALESSS